MGDGRVDARLRSPGAHDSLLRRIATDLLGCSVWEHRWIPSDEADVFELMLEGRTPRIVKIEREGMSCVQREAQAFPALRKLGFDEFPEIEFASGSIDGATAPFIVMPKTEGRPWSELWAEDRRLAVWVVEKIGDFLRRLAEVDWRDVPGVVSPHERIPSFADWFERFFAPLFEDPSVISDHRVRIARVVDAMREEPDGFGGWQFAQVLTDGRTSFVAIDWGNLGAYWRLHDLAAAIASLEMFGSGAATYLEPFLLDSFTQGVGLSDSDTALLERWLELWTWFGRAAELRARAT